MHISKPFSYVNTFSSQTYQSYPYKNIKQDKTAISTFSPVGLLSSNGSRMHVCVCTGIARNELIYSVGMPAKCILQVHSVYTHTHAHAHIIIPFEDREPTGLKVDIANKTTQRLQTGGSHQTSPTSLQGSLRRALM